MIERGPELVDGGRSKCDFKKPYYYSMQIKKFFVCFGVLTSGDVEVQRIMVKVLHFLGKLLL